MQKYKKQLENLNMKALILAGGFGTRLKSVINDKPKPMAPVNNIPFLEYQILQLKRYNLNDIVLCIGYLGDKIREYFGDGSKWNVNILYSHEKEPLGTGGAIKNAETLISEDNFLAMNGDSFLDINLTELISHHIEKKALCTIALLRTENPKRYGTVQINGENKIKVFREKDETSKSGLINGGIYVFNRQIFSSIPENRKVSLERDIFPNILERKIYGLVVDGFFIDIGTPEEYERAQKIFHLPAAPAYAQRLPVKSPTPGAPPAPVHRGNALGLRRSTQTGAGRPTAQVEENLECLLEQNRP